MFYGEFERVVIEVRKRPVEPWMLEGDYINDRDFRSRFHTWLTQAWHEKDQRIGAIHDEYAERVAETANTLRQIA